MKKRKSVKRIKKDGVISNYEFFYEDDEGNKMIHNITVDDHRGKNNAETNKNIEKHLEGLLQSEETAIIEESIIVDEVETEMDAKDFTKTKKTKK